MLKATLSLLLFGYANAAAEYEYCPEGTGTQTNPCIIKPNALDKSSVIVIPSTIEYAEVQCGANEKGCEKEISVYSGAKSCKILCDKADTCLASLFVGGKGPPGFDQRAFNREDQVLEVLITAGSSAKEASVKGFGNSVVRVSSSQDAGFSGATYDCFGKECFLACSNGGCEKISCGGDKPLSDTSFCATPKAPLPIFAPIIMPQPGQNNVDCEIKPILGHKGPYVFTNRCKTAKMDCTTQPDICKLAKIFVGAQDFKLDCGGPYPNEPEKTIGGTCNSAKIQIGPFQGPFPFGTNENDFDISYTEDIPAVPASPGVPAVEAIPGKPIFNTAVINIRGSDGMGKGQINAVLTNIDIYTHDNKAGSELKLICGWEPASGTRIIPGGECNLYCMSDNTGGSSCDKCKADSFNAVLTQYLNGLVSQAVCAKPNANRVSQSSINSKTVNVNNDNNGDNINSDLNNGNNIVIPVKSIYAFAIIFAVIVIGTILGCLGINNKNDKFEKKELLKYNTMEMQKQSVQNIA